MTTEARYLTDYGMTPEEVVALDERCAEMVREILDAIPNPGVNVSLVIKENHLDVHTQFVLLHRMGGTTGAPPR